MSYVIHEMSVKAKNMFVPTIPKKKPEFAFESERNIGFPLRQMKSGQSFYLLKSDTLPYIRTNCKDYIARYNRTYACYFVMIEWAWGWEIARLV